jgi:co-chaperonin GroES (HSP10)
VQNASGILPTEFKVLIEPDAVEEVSKGGIIIPVEKVDKDKYATTDGTIVAISHLAFTYATDAEWDGHKPKAGDRVAFAKYAGARRKGKDGKDYLLINDKDVVAIIE